MRRLPPKRLRTMKDRRKPPKFWLPGMPIPECPFVPPVIEWIAWGPRR